MSNAALDAARAKQAERIVSGILVRQRLQLSELSNMAKAARKPLPPEDLIEAQHDGPAKSADLRRREGGPVGE